MRIKRTIAAGLVALLAASGSVTAQQSENTLRWASAASITNIDPYYNAYREAMIINGQLVWDTLIYKTPDSDEFQPLLAKAWEWVDDKTLRFELREDVVFHDGVPLTAADAVYTFNYISDPANDINVQSNVRWIDHAEQTGEHSFLLYLDAPFPPALEYIASLHAILPEGFFGDTKQAGANGRLVGTGPYKIESFKPGDSISVTKSERYFSDSPKGKPGFDRIEYRFIPDQTTQVAELMSGGVDWIWRVPKDVAEPMTGRQGLTVQAGETMRIGFLYLNGREMDGGNPLTDQRVRQAIAHAINKPLIVDQIIGEGSSAIDSPCYRTQFGCTQDVVRYEYDPEKARKLLSEAGYGEGIEIDLVTLFQGGWTEAVAGFLEQAGIRTNIELLKYSAMRERVKNNELHVQHTSWGSYSINDVSALLNNFFTLSPDDMARDAELSDALVQATQTTDRAERKRLYDFAVKRISERAYWVPLWVHPVVYAHDSGLEFQSYPDENPRLFLAHW